MLITMSDGIGIVELYDFMTLDPSLKAVNVARGSFGKRNNTFHETRDRKLLDYLARESHTSPFRHSYVTLFVKAPEFVARQWWKHIVGSDYTFKDTGWNEISGRYVAYNSFFVPKDFYLQASNKKQGRSDEIHPTSNELREKYQKVLNDVTEFYRELVESGIAMEQARVILPLATYTEFYWTASAQTLHHFVSLRNKPDAQADIREYAVAVSEICVNLFGPMWQSMDTYLK